MAGFFDKVVEGLNRGVSTVSEGSKLLVEKANLNTKIKDVEKEKNLIIHNMGVLVYNLYANGAVKIEQCEGMCNEIAALDQKISSLQQQLQLLESGKTSVPQYENVAATGAVIENGVPCECGHINKEGSKFCAKCGKQLQ